MSSWIREKLHLGPSVVTGLSWGKNIAKLVAIVVIPFYCVWGVSQWSYYVWKLDEMIVTAQLGMGISLWLSGIYGFYAHVKGQASEYLSFPASKWRFSETQVNTIDLVVKEEAVEYIGHFDKFYAYRLNFPFLIGYNHPDLGLLAFSRAYWLMPAEWEEQFFFRGGGEIWYGGFPLTHAKAEDVSLHVYPFHRWEVNERELIPVALVCDSKLHYQATMKKLPEVLKTQLGEKPDPGTLKRTMIAALTKENIGLKLQANSVEEELEAKLNESFNQVKTRKKIQADHKRRYGNILRYEEPLRWKIFNARNLFLLGLLIVGALAVWGWFFAGAGG
jgi:hypothetical protein